jgi:hypothetical protein
MNKIEKPKAKDKYIIHEIFNEKGQTFSEVIEEVFLQHLILQALKTREETAC